MQQHLHRHDHRHRDRRAANGNLLVSGEKQIGINQGTEFIRFSGVVNPRTVTGSNTVPSTQVADARIEYTARATSTRPSTWAGCSASS